MFVIFFSVRATTLNFFEFYFLIFLLSFYALRRSLANFQDYIAPSGQTLFQIAWRKVPKMKKGQEKPKFVKKWVRQKRAYQVANFFLLKSFILSWSKSLKSFRLIAFMVLERLLGGHVWPPTLTLALPTHTQRVYTEAIRNRVKLFFLLLYYSEFRNIVKDSFWILNALNRNCKCATFRLNLILFGCISVISRVFMGYVYFKRLLLLHYLYLTCPF